eukprot:scaffold42732_cov21-Tisochrysis_lutea.AAC.1
MPAAAVAAALMAPAAAEHAAAGRAGARNPGPPATGGSPCFGSCWVIARGWGSRCRNRRAGVCLLRPSEPVLGGPAGWGPRFTDAAACGRPRAGCPAWVWDAWHAYSSSSTAWCSTCGVQGMHR